MIAHRIDMATLSVVSNPRGHWAAVPPAKAAVPAPPAGLVRRDALSAAVRVGTQTDVTLVCAPAGYGKTTLLWMWADDRNSAGDGPVAWLCLDGYDNDLFRLWSGILHALRTAADHGTGERLAELSPPRDDMEPGFLAAFTDVIDSARRQVWLVLDDAHHIRDAAAVQSLEMLMRRLPRQLKLVFSCRSDPPLPHLRRLRLAGQLFEVRMRPLAFNRGEAVQLLATHDVQLPDPSLDLLLRRTEGWPAALRLAGISLEGRTDSADAVARLTSSDVNVADYLFGEVLARQPEHVRQFMLTTSVCDEFTEELAEALSGQPAAAILEQLERDNALIVRTGPGGSWYRYHPLLRSYAATYLRRQHILAGLHGTASAWFGAHGDVERAAEHAVAADDADAVTTLIEQHGLRLVLSGRSRSLRRLRRSSSSQAADRPLMMMILAVSALDLGDTSIADDFLERLATFPDTELTQRQQVLHGTTRLLRAIKGGDIRAALNDLAKVYRADCGDPDLDLLALTCRGTAATGIGDHGAAEADLRRAVALAQRLGYDYVRLGCLTALAASLFTTGDLDASGAAASKAVALAGVRGWSSSPQCAYAHAVNAWIAYLRMDTEAAARRAAAALVALRSHPEPVAGLAVRSIYAAIGFDSTDPHTALRQWCAIWDAAAGIQPPLHVMAFGAAVQVRLALAAGDVPTATMAIDRIRTQPGLTGEIRHLRAQIHARQGHRKKARQLLRPVLSGRVPHLVTTAIDAWLLDAVLAYDDGQLVRSRRAVDKAVTLAAPRWALRAFVAAGQPLRELLVRDQGRFGPHEKFVSAVVSAVQSPGASPVEPLSERELELLAELPSMRTVEQLAKALSVSPNTIKTHLRHIYRKLGVSARRDAVTAGRRRGLI